MSAVLQVLGCARRRAILREVWSEERTAGEVFRAFEDVTFGAVSQHLSRLLEAGLLEVRREGRHRYYRARPEALGPLREWLEQSWTDALKRLEERAEMEAQRRGPRANRRVRARPRTNREPTEPRSRRR